MLILRKKQIRLFFRSKTYFIPSLLSLHSFRFTNFITLKKPGQLELCTEFFRQRECESQFIDALIRNGNSTELKLFLRSVYDGDRVSRLPFISYLSYLS